MIDRTWTWSSRILAGLVFSCLLWGPATAGVVGGTLELQIPRIINHIMPAEATKIEREAYAAIRKRCIELHPGWKFKMWTLQSGACLHSLSLASRHLPDSAQAILDVLYLTPHHKPYLQASTCWSSATPGSWTPTTASSSTSPNVSPACSPAPHLPQFACQHPCHSLPSRPPAPSLLPPRR